MISRAVLTATFATFALTLAPLHSEAGELDPALSDRIAGTAGGEMVRVWIKMPDQQDGRSFKRAVESSAATRLERHTLALERLKAKASGQRDLLDHLDGLARAGHAARVKGHWIVNVVEAEVAAGELARLAARDDIETIYPVPEIALVEPVDYGPAPASPEAIEANLTHINAPNAWGLGYRGTGRLVCSFDTGVWGGHPALRDRWKGLDGDSAAAWFDPLDQIPYPHSFAASGVIPWHGTHVMGIMVGYDQAQNDYYGVAPDAKWMSAAVVDLPGASLLDAFEWASDPDGNPNTVDDVPDVINHSWGFRYLACAPVFYDAIDNTEALGIVNIFSAGNEGSAASSIRNPADRALDSVDCFAVGDLNHLTETIVAYSSRGPSPCNPLGIKPNVVAPGNLITSCWYTGGYSTGSGTSQAAPHVSGLVALLRQKNPNATADEIKTAILTSTRTVAAWGELPNNTYGWGEIDCVAALNALPSDGPQPNLRVYDFAHIPIQPGDMVTGRVVLQNLGAAIGSVQGALVGANEAIQVIDGAVSFGAIGTNDTVRSIDDITVVIADTLTEGTILSMDFLITGSGPIYFKQVKLHFLVEPPQSKALATHSGNRITFTLSNFGVYGMGVNSTFPLGDVGFSFNGGVDNLFEAGVMVGKWYNQVSSGVHSLIYDPDMDFKVAPGGNMVLSSPGSEAAQQTFCRFDDRNADLPIGLVITQESFYYDPPNDSYLLLRYAVKNPGDTSISDIYFGLFFDFDLPSSDVGWNSDAGGYEPNGEFLWMAYNSGTALSHYRGLKLARGLLATAGAVNDTIFDHYTPPSGDGFTSDEKYNALISGLRWANRFKTAREDLFLIEAAGLLNLAPQQTDTLVFAILAGLTFADIQNAAFRVDSMLTDVESPDDGEALPRSFALYPNYPNPFNPATVIPFDLPVKTAYRLEVINMLGQTVFATEDVAGPGQVAVTWNGEGFASGAYFYRVTAGDRTLARKMMLVK